MNGIEPFEMGYRTRHSSRDRDLSCHWVYQTALRHQLSKALAPYQAP